jgi:hypothetical protein
MSLADRELKCASGCLPPAVPARRAELGQAMAGGRRSGPIPTEDQTSDRPLLPRVGARRVCRPPWSITQESPITATSYFSYYERLIDELNQGDIPPNYWQHTRDRTGQFERCWRLKAAWGPLSRPMEETK